MIELLIWYSHVVLLVWLLKFHTMMSRDEGLLLVLLMWLCEVNWLLLKLLLVLCGWMLLMEGCGMGTWGNTTNLGHAANWQHWHRGGCGA